MMIQRREISTLKNLNFQWLGQSVCITRQLAQFYECEENSIQKNYSRNKEKFVEGKHYFRLTGQQVVDFYSYYPPGVRNESVTVLYLWTERGAMLHAKMLKTDKAWQVYESLVDSYFQHREFTQLEQQQLKVQNLKRQIFSLENEPLTLLGFQQLSLKERKAQRSQIWEIWKNVGATKPALNYRRIQVAKRVNLIVNGMSSYAFKRRTQAAGLARDWMPLENQYCFYLAEFDLLNQLRQRNFAVSFEFIESLYPRLAYAAKARVEALCEVSLSINIEEEVDNVLRLVREQVEFQNTPYTQIEEQLLFCSNILVDESKRLSSLL